MQTLNLSRKGSKIYKIKDVSHSRDEPNAPLLVCRNTQSAYHFQAHPYPQYKIRYDSESNTSKEK